MKSKSNSVRLTVLLDDTVHPRELKAEHGLAILIEKKNDAVLFDTGQTALFLDNAKTLGKDLSRVRAVVLSHGHYDHTGGLIEALKQTKDATVHAHSDVFRTRYTIPKNKKPVSAGMRFRQREIEAVRQIVLSAEPVEVLPGIYTTGQVPRVTDFEDTGGPFFIDPEGKEKDELLDDMSLFFEADQGTIVVTGCAHAGIVNILEHVANLTGRRQMHTVIGGMHLIAASDERMKRTSDAFRDFNVQRIGVAHCTGLSATIRFVGQFPDAVFSCTTGLQMPL
ncbi:MAG: MBL fold metallo-hydrolase [Planctomycetes bacterium]|nr:MBL fold metallo-hydrolase [Planctomycetota bacterium]